MAINFAEDAGKVDITDADVKTISMLAKKQIHLELHLADIARTLEQVTDNLRQVQEVDLPNAMLEAGVSEIKLDTGETVSVKPDIYPSIPKDKIFHAYKWLRERGHGSLIKNNITVSFGRDGGEDAKAKDLLAELVVRGYKPERRENIHFQTLKAFVKEQMADPETEDLPEEFFSVHEVRKAVIKSS